MMGAARIGKIRMKGGGAEVRLLRRGGPNIDGENWRGDIVRHARGIAEMGSPGSDLVGFVVVGLFSDGCTSVGYAWDKARVPVNRLLMPAFMAELIRRELITSDEADRIACGVVNRSNGFGPET